MTCVYSLNRVHIKTSKQSIYELISEETRKGISVESVIRTEVYSTSCKLEPVILIKVCKELWHGLGSLGNKLNNMMRTQNKPY